MKVMKNIFISFFIVFLFTGCGPNPEKSDRLVEEGVLLAHYAKFNEAIEIYTEAIEYNPDNFEAYYQRANANASLRNYKVAIEDYNRAIEIHPKYADAYANRGQIKFYLKDNEGACEDWKIAESLGKDNMEDKTRFCK
jgi:tetratricopeptide (TPR) repeat protein